MAEDEKNIALSVRNTHGRGHEWDGTLIGNQSTRNTRKAIERHLSAREHKKAIMEEKKQRAHAETSWSSRWFDRRSDNFEDIVGKIKLLTIRGGNTRFTYALYIGLSNRSKEFNTGSVGIASRISGGPKNLDKFACIWLIYMSETHIRVHDRQSIGFSHDKGRNCHDGHAEDGELLTDLVDYFLGQMA